MLFFLVLQGGGLELSGKMNFLSFKIASIELLKKFIFYGFPIVGSEMVLPGDKLGVTTV